MHPDPAGCGGGSGGAGHPIRPSESLESIESAVAYRVSANTKNQNPTTRHTRDDPWRGRSAPVESPSIWTGHDLMVGSSYE